MGKNVDIIIPVYRGLEETKDCITSVLASKDKNKTVLNIIVINDCSPEPELSKYLVDISKDYGINLLANEVNLGFVATVNRGMSQTKNDVLLLNSDTVVANSWLDKLVYHADNNENIASITPFSNNATICSYPIFCAKNPLVIGESVESLDYYFEQANSHESIEIPTAVGFCMYIPRKAIEKVGLFDVDSFGKGYGEENDFSFRAVEHGLRNILALDTFVMHEGGVSFADMQYEFQSSGSKVLLKKYPKYNEIISSFIRANPAKAHKNKVNLLRIRDSDKPTILSITHVEEGGADKHIKELSEHFYNKANLLQLSPYKDSYIRLSWPTKFEELELFFPRSAKQDLINCLKAIRVDRVHYHHVVYDDFLIKLANNLDASFDITLHDYCFSCLNIHLNNELGVYCGEPFIEGNENRCVCAREKEMHTKLINKWQPFLQSADRIFAPSYDLINRFIKYYPGINIKYAPHLEKAKLFSKNRIPNGMKTKIMVLGAISQLKGGDILESVVKYAKKHQKLDFHLVGYTYNQLKTQSNLKVYGAYNDEDLPGLIDDICPDLFWFPSMVPETYSYTLSYAIASNLPIAATDIGAVAERLYSYPRSWILSYKTDTAGWVDLFLNYKNRDYTKMVKVINNDWSYEKDYLILTDKPKVSFDNNLVTYAKYSQIKGLFSAKQKVLQYLLTIKGNKLVSNFVKIIPDSYQAKLRNWLLGNK